MSNTISYLDFFARFSIGISFTHACIGKASQVNIPKFKKLSLIIKEEYCFFTEYKYYI